jgi:hypothetical protein
MLLPPIKPFSGPIGLKIGLFCSKNDQSVSNGKGLLKKFALKV